MDNGQNLKIEAPVRIEDDEPFQKLVTEAWGHQVCCTAGAITGRVRIGTIAGGWLLGRAAKILDHKFRISRDTTWSTVR